MASYILKAKIHQNYQQQSLSTMLVTVDGAQMISM